MNQLIAPIDKTWQIHFPQETENFEKVFEDINSKKIYSTLHTSRALEENPDISIEHFKQEVKKSIHSQEKIKFDETTDFYPSLLSTNVTIGY